MRLHQTLIEGQPPLWWRWQRTSA